MTKEKEYKLTIKQGRCDRERGIEWMAYTSKARKQEDA